MSREHLYKAKRVNWRELPKEEWWVEGSLIISDEDYYIVPDFGVSCVEKLNNYVCDKLITLHAFEVDKETVCQYTGLTDKNGMKIFEGDIVKAIYNPKDKDLAIDDFIIKWDKYYCKFVGYYVGKENVYNPLLFGSQTSFEVIGNSFDNPDLLKE